MTNRTLTIAGALAGALIVAAAGPARAAARAITEENALQGTKVTLSQAIATAERQTGGKAFDAGVDAGHGAPRIVVETNGAKGVRTVFVDAGTGQITGGHAGGEAD